MSAAEELPALYRALLDRVAEMEAAGHRVPAYRLRAAATKIYSKSWDDRARRGLQDLLSKSLEERLREADDARESRRKRVPAI